MLPCPSSIPFILAPTHHQASARLILAATCWASAVVRSSVQTSGEDGKSRTLCNNLCLRQFRMAVFLVCLKFSRKKQPDINKVSLE